MEGGVCILMDCVDKFILVAGNACFKFSSRGEKLNLIALHVCVVTGYDAAC